MCAMADIARWRWIGSCWRKIRSKCEVFWKRTMQVGGRKKGKESVMNRMESGKRRIGPEEHHRIV